MTTAIKRRRGTTTQHSTFTGLEGEITIDTTKDTAVVHDGATAGGRPLLREDLANNTEVVTKTGTQTLTNKTLTSPVINTPTGITKSDISLGNVDNTSDATKNAATATLTNKTITLGTNTITGTVAQFQAAVTDGDFATLAGTETLTNKAFNGSLGATTPSTIAGTTITSSSLTSGRVTFASTGGLLADNSNFVWDNTNARLGIGTASPARKLDVNGSIQLPTNNALYIKGSDNYFYADSSNTVEIAAGTSGKINFVTNGASRAILDSSGNLGIGTASPTEKLSVSGGIVATGSAVLSSGAGAYLYYTAGTTSAELTALSPGVAWLNQKYNALSHQFSTSGTERMRLDSSGNLGIGTNNPTIKLDVQLGTKTTTASPAVLAGFETTDAVGLQLGLYVRQKTDATAANRWTGLVSYDNGVGSSDLVLQDLGGNVLVGTTSSLAKLTVEHAIAFSGGGAAKPSGLGYGMYLLNGVGTVVHSAASLAFTSNSTERMRLDTSGNLLVGTTSAGGVGGITVRPAIGGAGTYGRIDINQNQSADGMSFLLNGTQVGRILISTTTSYVTTSDYRLKENVAPMTGALAKIQALKPVTYNWKSDGSDGQGFIAHELAEVVPDCVVGEKDATEEQEYEISPAIPAVLDEEGNEVTPAIEAVMGTRTVPVYQGIDTSFLVATLTAAIQEQQAMIDELKAKVAALEAA